METSLKLRPDSGKPITDPSLYRKLVGKLNYLTNTRPDLAYAVQFLSQFLQDPREPHWQAVMHTLRYLSKDYTKGIYLNASTDLTLEAYCDSDWASCPNTRRSVSGYFILLGGSPILWKSKKQATVSLSSAEAEYRSMRRVTAELAWLTRLLHEFIVPAIVPVPLKCDSQAAIYIARNLVYHKRTKHIDLDCHFVREKLQDGLISLSYVPTEHQLADIFTKSLSGPTHHNLVSKLGMLSPSNLRGVLEITYFSLLQIFLLVLLFLLLYIYSFAIHSLVSIKNQFISDPLNLFLSL